MGGHHSPVVKPLGVVICLTSGPKELFHTFGPEELIHPTPQRADLELSRLQGHGLFNGTIRLFARFACVITSQLRNHKTR